MSVHRCDSLEPFHNKGGTMDEEEFEKNMEEAAKTQYIERACEAAKLIMAQAEADGVFMDMVGVWNKDRTASYESAVLERHNLINEEDEY
jgi:hypothetical protein